MADEKAEQAALGNLIRQKRQARGLSQEQLAQQLEVSRQAVAKWESGKGFPSAERLLYLAQVLDIPAEGRCADIAPDLERRSKRIEEPGGSRVFCIHTSFCTPHYVIFQIALGADLCYNTNTIYAMMRKEGTGDEGSFQFEGAAA